MQKQYIYKIYKKKKKGIYKLKKKKTIGFYEIKSLENTFLKKNNFESIRRLLSRKVKKKLKFLIYKNSNKLPLFNKPLKVRMGSGKGNFSHWLWKFKKYQKIFEISFFKKYFLIKKYLIKINKKIPCKLFLTIN